LFKLSKKDFKGISGTVFEPN